MLAVGLSWCVSLRSLLAVRVLKCQSRQALSCIAAGYCIISVVMVLNGTIGARLHVAFPVLNRSSFGFWFSYFTVVSRIILAMFWFGILVSRVLHHRNPQPADNPILSHITGRNACIR